MSATANREVGHYAAPDFTGRDEKRLSYYRPAAIESRSKARLERIGWMVQEVAGAKSAIVKAAAETKDDPEPLSAIDIAQERYQDCRKQGLTDRKEIRDRLLPDVIAAFATVAKETVGYEPRELQYQAATLLYEGNGKKGLVADIKTGEGKTITTALTATMFAVDGQSVHVATRNDYLAKRDAEQMGAIYAQLGLKVGVIQSTGETYIYDPATGQLTAAPHRSDAYACDVVYGVGTEFGFDYLRDNTALSKDQLRQVRGRAHLVVDEADDVMVNQATTPLIIYKDPTAETPQKEDDVVLEIEGKKFTFGQMTRFMAGFVEGLEEGQVTDPGGFFTQMKEVMKEGKLGALLKGDLHLQNRKQTIQNPTGDFVANYAERQIYLTSRGFAVLQKELLLKLFRDIPHVERFTKYAEDLFSEPEVASTLMYYLQNALKAQCFYQRDIDYQVLPAYDPQTNQMMREIVLMDTATLGGGRPLLGRRLEEDLHAAIEAKERRQLPPRERHTLRITSDQHVGAVTTFQNYFSLYDTLAGMTGTATYAAEEFYDAYKTDIVMIPRHTETKMVRHDVERIFAERQQKFDWIADEVFRIQCLPISEEAKEKRLAYMQELVKEERQRLGLKDGETSDHIPTEDQMAALAQKQRPMLIGFQTPDDVMDFHEYLKLHFTGGVINKGQPNEERVIGLFEDPLNSRLLRRYLETYQPDLLLPENSDLLAGFVDQLPKVNLNLNWLTGENSTREQSIIADAGKLNTITITCMAGRGTDIQLGGPQGTTIEHQLANYMGGLYVIGEHGTPESDEQLAGRGARWEDEGDVVFVSSMDDLLFRRAWGEAHTAREQQDMLDKDAGLIEGAAALARIRECQSIIARSVTESRKHLRESYEVYNEQRNVLYADREKILTAGELDSHTGALMELMVDDIVSTYEQKRHNSPYTDTDGLAEELLAEIADILPLRVFPYSKQKQLVQLVRVANGNPIQPTSLRDLLDQLSPEQRRLLSEGNLRQLLLPFFEEAYVAATVQREQEALAAIKAADSRDSIVIRQFHQNEAAKRFLEDERRMFLEVIDSAWGEQLDRLKFMERTRWLQQPLPTQMTGFTGAENPDVWYARESAALFEQRKKQIRREIVGRLIH